MLAFDIPIVSTTSLVTSLELRIYLTIGQSKGTSIDGSWQFEHPAVVYLSSEEHLSKFETLIPLRAIRLSP